MDMGEAVGVGLVGGLGSQRRIGVLEADPPVLYRS